ARGTRILAALDDIAARTGSSPAGVALAWLMARPSITAPIASATSVQQLEELIAATWLKLDADAVKQLDAASA
ncbi:MAG TPA: aldo/keto reductase, partial [Hyphomicrobiaceae bacterium]